MVARVVGVVAVMAVGWSSSAYAQATGSVVGVLRDDYNAITLPGVAVEVVDSTEVAYTDIDGKFILELAPGTYTLRINFPGYAERTVQVVVVASRASEVDVGISPTSFAETLTVVGEVVQADTSSAEAQLVERKRAPVITDNMGASEMKANADSDAASALQRVTGLSVVDDQYVFVRGLGERYSNTVLGGATLPSTDPERRVVSLDLFPAGLIDSVQIEKSYLPDRPAEFAGGLVQIEPLKFARTTTFDVSGSFGFNSLTTFDNVLNYPGGGHDWTGFDDGTRAIPGAVPDRKVIRGGIYTPTVGVLQSDLNAIGASFANVWEPVSQDARPDQSYGLVYGDRWGKFGVMSTYTYSQKSQYQAEEQNYYRTSTAGLTPFSQYDLQQATTRSTQGVVGNAAYQFSTNHQLSVENFWTHTGLNETREFSGFNSDIATTIENSRLRWLEEDLFATTVSGDHLLGGSGGNRIDWRVSYAQADRNEPDLREVLYELDTASSRFVLADESQSGFRMFNDLADETIGGALNSSTFFTGPQELPAQVKFGVAYDDRTRDFASRRFRLVHANTSGIDLSLSPEQLFVPQNIGTVFQFKEETRSTDTYDASQTLAAGYAMVDLPLSATWRIVGGARVENFEQTVNTFDQFSLELSPVIIQAKLNDTDVFPSINLVNSLTPAMNLRFGVSQTVNRPEFRELAPFEFTDVVGGGAIVGNEILTRALIRNFDVRWEWFSGAGELVAASFFYKDFTDPIERIVEPTAQLRTSFTNAESARNVGFELEARRSLGQYYFVAANYTFVDSEITLADAARQVQTSLNRPLAGQSRNLFNAMFEVRRNGYSGRLLFNFFGDRISDVGSLGLPDIIEQGRNSLDLVFVKRWEHLASLKFSIGNLLDDDFEFRQSNQIQRLYNLGRTFVVSFGYSLY